MGKTPPVVELEYISGLRVVDIGDYRVSRGISRRPSSACNHIRLVYDNNERRVWCKDCEQDVEPFDAFCGIVGQFSKQVEILKRREKEIDDAEKFAIRSIAAKVIDEAWRSHKMIPACPHCGEGIFPEDVKNGIGMVGKEYALARRKKLTNQRKELK